jgi:hypothetical protein
MRRELKDWMDLPLPDITPSVVKAAIQGIVDRGAPTIAHFLLAVTRGFFNWVIESGVFNLSMPTASL